MRTLDRLALVLAACSAATGQAVWQRSAGPGPQPRGGAAMAYDIGRGRAVLFGGWDNATYFGDTWEWNGVAWTQIQSLVSPSPRWRHAMTYDPGRQRIVLFGGGQGV